MAAVRSQRKAVLNRLAIVVVLMATVVITNIYVKYLNKVKER